jgi:hypothetical protein
MVLERPKKAPQKETSEKKENQRPSTFSGRIELCRKSGSPAVRRSEWGIVEMVESSPLSEKYVLGVVSL